LCDAAYTREFKGVVFAVDGAEELDNHTVINRLMAPSSISAARPVFSRCPAHYCIGTVLAHSCI
jgi:hypothetical protein